MRISGISLVVVSGFVRISKDYWDSSVFIAHHTNGTSAAPRRAAPRGAARRLSAPCRAGPRHAETPEQCAQTVKKQSTSGGTRLGPPLISAGPNRGSFHNLKTIRATRRNEDKNPTVDGIKFATSTKWKNDNDTQQTTCKQATVSPPRAPKAQCWYVREGVGVA